jgi:hypothetical protein
MSRLYRFPLTVAAGVFALAASATLAFGQWPDFPSRGPRGKDGKIDLAGPSPKTIAGKPDFSGLWEPTPENPKPDQVSYNGLPPLPYPIPRAEGDPPVGQFFNIGAGFKDGLPFTPWAAALRAERKDAHAKDNPDAHCLPMGLTQLHMHIQPRKVVQSDQEIVLLYEANGNTRQILLDGRALPKNATPWWYGYSIGHWDGETLVVENAGFRDDVWLDVDGSPLTSSGKITERWRRPKFGLMQIDLTIEDPKSYTKPFTVRVNHRLMPDTELMEFVCEERDATHYR